MSENNNTNYKRILNYIDLIKRNPKKDVKFFYFDEGSKFIVDGNRLKLLPFMYHQFYLKDEFYVHVNPIEQKVMYYAFDIGNYIEADHIKEEEGYMAWKDVEDCIYNFFVLNIKDLTGSATPYMDVQEPSRTTTFSGNNANHHIHSGYNNVHTSPYGYGTQAYRDREAFFDKLWPLIKENKTSKAMDLIGEHVAKMCNDKKFEELNIILSIISFDKLNVPTMLGILDATYNSDHLLKSRKDFYEKVRSHITKLKPARAGIILRNLEPGKSKDITVS
jgi:hypothetical protein